MSKLLTVEMDKDSVEIHFNNEGVDFLISALELLKQSKSNNHSHFMTNDFGGNELTNIKQNEDYKTNLVHHLKLFYWCENK